MLVLGLVSGLIFYAIGFVLNHHVYMMVQLMFIGHVVHMVIKHLKICTMPNPTNNRVIVRPRIDFMGFRITFVSDTSLENLENLFGNIGKDFLEILDSNKLLLQNITYTESIDHVYYDYCDRPNYLSRSKKYEGYQKFCESMFDIILRMIVIEKSLFRRHGKYLLIDRISQMFSDAFELIYNMKTFCALEMLIDLAYTYSTLGCNARKIRGVMTNHLFDLHNHVIRKVRSDKFHTNPENLGLINACQRIQAVDMYCWSELNKSLQTVKNWKNHIF